EKCSPLTTAKISATNATWKSEPTMRESPGRNERAAYRPERANRRAVSRYANARKRSVPCQAVEGVTCPRRASLSSSAVKIASATAAQSSASSESTRARRLAVEMRRMNESTGGRLRRMSRAEVSWRSVAADRAGLAGARCAGFDCDGKEGARGAVRVGVPD